MRDEGFNQDPQPMIYVPQAQAPTGMTAIDVRVLPMTWAVRTTTEPHSMAQVIQRELRMASGGLAVGRVVSMDDVVKQSTARSDFNLVLLAAFAGIALLLAAVGIYGLISFSVGQRARELAIRGALGATPEQLRAICKFATSYHASPSPKWEVEAGPEVVSSHFVPCLSVPEVGVEVGPEVVSSHFVPCLSVPEVGSGSGG